MLQERFKLGQFMGPLGHSPSSVTCGGPFMQKWAWSHLQMWSSLQKFMWHIAELSVVQIAPYMDSMVTKHQFSSILWNFFGEIRDGETFKDALLHLRSGYSETSDQRISRLRQVSAIKTRNDGKEMAMVSQNSSLAAWFCKAFIFPIFGQNFSTLVCTKKAQWRRLVRALNEVERGTKHHLKMGCLNFLAFLHRWDIRHSLFNFWYKKYFYQRMLYSCTILSACACAEFKSFIPILTVSQWCRWNRRSTPPLQSIYPHWRGLRKTPTRSYERASGEVFCLMFVLNLVY